MRRSAGAFLALFVVGGCMSAESSGGPEGAGGCNGCYGRAQAPPSIRGVQGPWGQPVPMIQPYASMSPGSAAAQAAMMSTSLPPEFVQASGAAMPGAGSDIMQAQALSPASCPPGGCPPNMMPPPGGLLSPFGLPGTPGMGPGPMMPMTNGGAPLLPPGAQPPAGAVAAAGALVGGNGMRFPTQRTQVRFTNPSGMTVGWYTKGSDSKESYSDAPIHVPGRYNFVQGAIYRLKLGNIRGRPDLFVFPTLEVVPGRPETEAFLAHSAVPLEFSDEDFKQITAGNYVVKVIYLPRPENQEQAGTGPDAIISTQLEPGADPITEALRRGYILLVIRMGNVDQDLNVPPLGAAAANAGAMPQGAMGGPPMGMGMPGMPMAMVPGMPGPGQMMPIPMMGPGGQMMPPNLGMMPPGGQMPYPGNAMTPPGMPMMPPNPGMMSPNGQMPTPGTAQVPPPGPMMPPNLGMMPPSGSPAGNAAAAPFGPNPVMWTPPMPPLPGPSSATSSGGSPTTSLPNPGALQRVSNTMPPRPGSALQPAAPQEFTSYP